MNWLCLFKNCVGDNNFLWVNEVWSVLDGPNRNLFKVLQTIDAAALVMMFVC
jgi:hypothetical protein